MRSSACQAPININMLHHSPSSLNPYNSVRQVPNSPHMTCGSLMKVTERPWSCAETRVPAWPIVHDHHSHERLAPGFLISYLLFLTLFLQTTRQNLPTSLVDWGRKSHYLFSKCLPVHICTFKDSGSPLFSLDIAILLQSLSAQYSFRSPWLPKRRQNAWQKYIQYKNKHGQSKHI